MVVASDAVEAPRRADAVRNRERVISAAEAVFAERGIEAGVPEIAERAGVGKGTVYRNFETKDDLIAAVLTKRTDSFVLATEKAIEKDDAMQAFSELLRETVTGKLKNGTFIIGLNFSEEHEELEAARARSREALDRLMRKAKKQGTMRKDVKADDVHVLFGGICRVLVERNEEDEKVWRRQTDLVVDSFRA
jgi:AcrR family transcriptional regulator